LETKKRMQEIIKNGNRLLDGNGANGYGRKFGGRDGYTISVKRRRGKGGNYRIVILYRV
jgi:hypothetical protein